MKRLSSSATLLLTLFVPMGWAVFFGSFTIAVFVSSSFQGSIMGSWIFRIGLLLFYILGLLLLKYTLLRLKRIEIDDNHLYAYNYFKSFRYDHDSVETINDLDFLLFHLGKITLKEKGSFGKHLYFLQSKQKFRSFLPQVPRLYEKLVQKKEEPEQSE